MYLRKCLFFTLAMSIGLSAPAVQASQNASRVAAQEHDSPAARAANLLRSDRDRLTATAEAADVAVKAAERAMTAAKDAERAAEAARLAAEGAVGAAREAKLALKAAQASARHPRAPMPGAAATGESTSAPTPAEVDNTGPRATATSPAARAFNALAERRAARAAASKPPAAKPIERTTALRVGRTEQYRMPSLAARAARDGDVIEIAAGDYRGDVAVWRADNLTIRGVGGRARLEANGEAAQGKAIWAPGPYSKGSRS